MNVLTLLVLLLPQAAPAGREDFEDEPFAGGLPEGWRRVEDEHHPAYNEAAVVRDPAANSGTHVLRLRTQRGAVTVEQLPKKAWRIEAGRPYRLSGRARLLEPKANAASLTITWRNRRFEPLGERTSAPLHEGGEWRELALELPPAPADCLWATVRLTYDGPDVRGECAFDRIELAPAVRLEVRPAGRDLALFETGQPLRLEVSAVGLAPGEHGLEVDVRGPSGPELRRPFRLLLPAPRPQILELPALAPGAFVVSVHLATPLLKRELPLLVANRWTTPPSAAPPFGLSFNPIVGDAPSPGELLGWIGARRARVVFWDVPPPAQGAPPSDADLFEFLQRLARGAPGGLEITGVLARPPRTLASQRGFDTMAEFLAQDRTVWEPPVRATLSRFRELVPWWQAGTADDAPAQGPDEFLKQTEGRRLKILPAADLATLLRALVQQAASGDPVPVLLSVAPPLVDAAGAPAAGLLALRALNDILAGARPRTPLLQLGTPVREFAFEKDGRVLFALWSESGEVEREIQIGAGAAVYPPLGAVRPMAEVERLRLGPVPVFVAGADAFFLESQSSLRLSDPERPADGTVTLPLRADPTRRLISFRNLSEDLEITDVRIRLEPTFPADWIVRPRTLGVERLARRKELSQELSFTLPPGESERDQELRFEIRFQRDGKEHVMQATRIVRLQSPIVVEPRFQPSDSDPDARKVSFKIVNGSADPVNLLLRLRLPGLPEQLVPLGRLLPGAEASTPDYVVSGLTALAPAYRIVDLIGEERGGGRIQFRKTIPLR